MYIFSLLANVLYKEIGYSERKGGDLNHKSIKDIPSNIRICNIRT